MFQTIINAWKIADLSKKLTVQVNAYSESAKQKIEAAGGKAEVI